jgi:hypothetical protein
VLAHSLEYEVGHGDLCVDRPCSTDPVDPPEQPLRSREMLLLKKNRAVLDCDDRPAVTTRTECGSHKATLDKQRTIRASASDLGGVATRMEQNVAPARQLKAAMSNIGMR